MNHDAVIMPIPSIRYSQRIVKQAPTKELSNKDHLDSYMNNAPTLFLKAIEEPDVPESLVHKVPAANQRISTCVPVRKYLCDW